MMATLNLNNNWVRSANTNGRDGQKDQMHIAAYGCVFLAPGAVRAAQVVSATTGWTASAVAALNLKKNH